MYETFYKLKAEPFKLSPDHHFCYEHKCYTKARAYMAYAENEADAAPDRPLDESERLFEYMLNALRLDDGFDEREFAERARLDPAVLVERAAPAIEKGLLERTDAGRWAPTSLGRRFLNDLVSGFLP